MYLSAPGANLLDHKNFGTYSQKLKQRNILLHVSDSSGGARY